MDPALMLDELVRVAESVGLEVKSQALRGARATHGGFCRLPGRALVVLSTNATPLERCAVLAKTLGELGHAGNPGLSPEARALVERRGRFPAPAAKPTKTSKGPGLAGLGGRGRRRV